MLSWSEFLINYQSKVFIFCNNRNVFKKDPGMNPVNTSGYVFVLIGIQWFQTLWGWAIDCSLHSIFLLLKCTLLVDMERCILLGGHLHTPSDLQKEHLLPSQWYYTSLLCRCLKKKRRDNWTLATPMFSVKVKRPRQWCLLSASTSNISILTSDKKDSRKIGKALKIFNVGISFLFRLKKCSLRLR